MVEVFCSQANTLMRGLERPPRWSEVLDLEPGSRRTLEGTALDHALEAIADFSDLKSPAFLGHSHGVATLARRAGESFGLPPEDAKLLEQAALVHDVGKTGVSTTIWASAERLSDREWESVRLHPYHTGRVFARSEALNRLGQLAAMHHERIDGSGYHGGLPAAMQPAAARILTAANRFRALLEDRPHRAACSPEEAARQLRAEVLQKRLDQDAVAAVLTAAGEPITWRRKAASAALTDREVQVVRLLARGGTMKEVAAQLEIAYKTVDRHTQSIYSKIGVKTRAGATLWAVEHGLT